jgi:xanthine dehydrogenase accessory factor
MNDILPDLIRWRQEGDPIALATVIQTWGSSPRAVGAKMGVAPGGRMVGSVSGGCVEGAVIEAALETLQSQEPQLLHFGVADETAWEVGLACGGEIEVFVQPLDGEVFEAQLGAIQDGAAAAALTILSGPAGLAGQSLVWRGGAPVVNRLEGALADVAAQAAADALQEGRGARLQLGQHVEAFVDVLLPPRTLVIVGGVQIAIALARFARELGYRTVIVDPRRAFGNQERFPFVDRLVQSWPDQALLDLNLGRASAVAVLTHDPKLDDPALRVALPGPSFYVGALGSRKTQAKRRARLLEAGLTEAQLDRLHGPIGLDIGARSPEEIALAIMAEIVAAQPG